MNLLICMQCQEESSNHVKQMRQLWNLAHTHFWQLSWLSFSLSCNLLVGIKSVIHGFVFWEGDFLGCCCMVGKVGRGGVVKWPWYMLVHIGEPNIVLCECARHITVVCLLIGRFLGGLSYLGVNKNKDSFFIYYHILTFGKFLPKYEGKACRFLHTNSKLLPLILD